MLTVDRNPTGSVPSFAFPKSWRIGLLGGVVAFGMIQGIRQELDFLRADILVAQTYVQSEIQQVLASVRALATNPKLVDSILFGTGNQAEAALQNSPAVRNFGVRLAAFDLHGRVVGLASRGESGVDRLEGIQRLTSDSSGLLTLLHTKGSLISLDNQAVSLGVPVLSDGEMIGGLSAMADIADFRGQLDERFGTHLPFEFEALSGGTDPWNPKLHVDLKWSHSLGRILRGAAIGGLLGLSFFVILYWVLHLINKASAVDVVQQRSRRLRAIFHDLIGPLQCIQSLVGESSSDQRISGVALRLETLLHESLKEVHVDDTIPSVQQVFSDLDAELGAFARSLKVGLRFEAGGPSLHAMVRPVELRRALENLIRNSLESSRQFELETGMKPGVVVVRAFTEHDRVRFEITDGGMGLRASRIPPGGHGIGLSNVRDIVHRAGGSFDLRLNPSGAVAIMDLSRGPFPRTEFDGIDAQAFRSASGTCVLIDDDRLSKEIWLASAARAQVFLKCFDSVEQLLADASGIPTVTPIFLDVTIRGTTPERMTSILYRNGYERLWWVSFLRDSPWISSKTPPWDCFARPG